jgi:3-keto-L-gulonate-6-phosphate decarboxylase
MAEIVVKDIRGVKLISSIRKVNGDRTIIVDMKGYSKGLYFVEIKGPTISKTSKFLKNE